MLRGLRIANFKAFGHAQRVPLRPLTLLFGANSAGKSSVLHALSLAHHAAETGNLDVHGTQIGGDSIDLGGFRQYVHRREQDQQVVLGFELAPGGLPGRARDLLSNARSVLVELGIGRPVKGQTPDGDVSLQRFGIEVDNQAILSMSIRRDERLRIDRLDHAHPVFREMLGGILALSTTTEGLRDEDLQALGRVLDDAALRIRARRETLFPRVDAERGSESDRAEPLLSISRSRREEDLAHATGLLLPRLLRELVQGIGAAVETELQGLRYLGPLRSYPPRHLAFSQHHDPNWSAGGGWAWDVARKDRDVRARVNRWLGDAGRLKTPYELEARELVPASALAAELAPSLEPVLFDLAFSILRESEGAEQYRGVLDAAAEAVRDSVAHPLLPDDAVKVAVANMVDAMVDVDGVLETWTQEIAANRGHAFQDLVLIDKRSGTRVSHRDVGIGVSQVLPVLVSAYASERELLAIEQPEIHLHPALQAELGDVFIESALGGAGNRFLIETHSEHLLLRIMRRMRQTVDDALPEGVPPVRPEDVAVLFVEPDGGHSLIREMPLNERGDLVKAWPGGFFEEDMREIF